MAEEAALWPVKVGSKVLDIETSTPGVVAELAHAPSGNLWLRVRLEDGRDVVAHREAFAVLPGASEFKEGD